VQVLAPQKNETVLDPACGTAGFLISAYKYMLKHSKNLTPDESARLMTNFCGYDIAPDMVRLSRVNLYLHGFRNPVNIGEFLMIQAALKTRSVVPPLTSELAGRAAMS
jgi:type I restriction-modification system DNA methylase subunit